MQFFPPIIYERWRLLWGKISTSPARFIRPGIYALLAFILFGFSSLSQVSAQTCGDISLDDCSTIVVPLDYHLSFNGCEDGIQDGQAIGTGFTMVQSHSEARMTQDQFGSNAPFQSFPSVPGYEPSRLSINNGVLTITASKGIAFLNPNLPSGSQNNNNQVNTLGVGLQNPSQEFVIKTQINNLTTGTQSAQAGLWYGLDEDNFVKVVATNNNSFEIRVEENGQSTSGTNNATTSGNFAGNTVTLEIVINPTALTAEGFFTIANGARTSIGSLTIPAAYITGNTLSDGTSGVSFAGIFATHRNNANSFDADFESFSVFPSGVPEMTFSVPTLAVSVPGAGTTTQSVDLTPDSGTPTVNLSANSCDGSGIPAWLTVGGNTLDGSVTHNTTISDIGFEFDATGLSVGTYEATVTASASGYVSTQFLVQLTVTSSAPLFSVDINFQDAGTTPPAGYFADFGEPYGLRTAANQGSGQYTYGWISVVNGSPENLVGQGRNRGDGSVSLLRNTIIHMEHPSTPPTGYWEIEVPNGTYAVTVTAGDVTGGSDPETHRVNAEGVNIINDFTPSGSGNSRFSTASGTCTVSDGKLTLDYSGGSGINTKLAHVEISQTSGNGGGGQLSIQSVVPAPGAVNVDCFSPLITTNGFNFIPGAGSLDNSTLIAGSPGNPGTVNLYDGSTLIAGSVNGTGGGDNISFSPNADLTPNTTYTFEITSGVQDISGNSMQPWSSTFTTGNCTGGPDPTLADFNVNKVVGSGGGYTSLTIGPDDKLYGLTAQGLIKRWDIVRTGDPTVAGSTYGTLTNEEVINTIQTAEGGNRLAIGMDFDPSSTASNLILWVSHSTFGFSGMADWGGKISRLSGPNLGTYQVYIENLPRSIRDHLTNGIDFGPDGAMYVMQGSNSAMGAPDGPWGNRPERLLTAACLRIEPALITNPPLDVQTEAGGTYDPYAPNAPVKIFATGTRNPYDLVWHSNNNLYIPTNGSAAGGNSPASVVGTLRPDGTTYSAQDQVVPAVNGHPTQPDLLFRVPAPVNGTWPHRYFGHPNPTRGEYVLNGGNPTNGADPLEVGGYPVGTTPDASYAGIAFNFLNSKSPNGVIEYQSNAFGGALQGALIVCRYSGGDDLYALVPGGNGDIVSDGTLGGSGTVSNPLDIIEDVQTGVLYVSEYGPDQIRALIPDVPATGGQPQMVVSPSEDIVQDQTSGSGTNTVTVTVSNPGTGDLVLNSPVIAGTDAGEYSLDLTAFQLTVAAGGSTTFDLIFDPSSNGPKSATLTLSGNVANPVVLELKGLGKQGTGGSNEPSLQWILDAYQLGITVGDDNPATNIIHSQNAQQSAAPLGPDEVLIPSFQKAGQGNVSLELLSVYGPTGSNPVVKAGYYLTGDANSTVEVLSVDNTPTSNGQRLDPPIATGSLSFDPGNAAFGFYSEWPAFNDRQLFSEDALNTFNQAIPHHVRVYPLPGENNAYVIATEEHISGFDFQDIVFIARNVQPAAPSFAGDIRLENMWKIPGTQTAYPSDSFIVFSRINNVNNHQNRESQTLRIHNDDGTDILEISALTFSHPSEWDFPNGEDQNLPLTIQPGSFVDLDIDFVKSSGGKGVYKRTLTISSSDGDEPSLAVTLSGAYMVNPEGGNEINAQQVIDAFGYTTTMLSGGNPQPQPSSDYPDSATIASLNAGLEGDWVFPVDGWFTRADQNEPVTAFQLAAYHGPGGAPTVTTGGGNNISFNHNGNWHQSLLPQSSANTGVASDISNVTGQFRLQTAGFGTEGENLGSTTPDLGYRAYKVRDANGDIIPNVLIGIQDYVGSGCGAGSANCDWNDNVVFWINVKPVGDMTLADIPDQTGIAGVMYTEDLSQYTSNGYAGNQLVYAAELSGGTPLPQWLSVDPQTGILSGMPPFNVAAPLDIVVTVTDDNQNVVTDPFQLTINGTTNLAFDGNELIGDASSCGVADGSIQVGTTGAASLVTYTITPGGVSNTTGLFSNLLPGNYVIQAEEALLPGVFISDAFVVGPSGCATCTPISTLDCGLIEVDLTNCFELTWDTGEGGIANTGFTMVDAPSETLSTTPAPDDPAVPGLVSANLNISGGQLLVTSTKGIQFQKPPASQENNTQQNALGVGFDASASAVTIQTTLVNPDFSNSGANNSQQAGLWFGLDEDNYVKLVVAKTGANSARVQLLRENINPGNPAVVIVDESNSANNAITSVNTQTIILYMDIDPVTNTVSGSYSLDSGLTSITLGNSLSMPSAFTDGQLLQGSGNDTMSFAGIFTTHRAAPEADAITFAFENFLIQPQGNNCQPPANVPPVAVADSATTDENVAVNISVLANDSDSDGTLNPSTIDLDPSSPGTEETIFTIVGEGVFTFDANNQVVVFTPDAGFIGTSTASYTVKDDDGDVSNTVTITVVVNDVNDVPVAVDDNETTNEDQVVAISILVNDSDSDGTIDANTVDLDPSSSGTEETVFTVANEGSYSYDANTGTVTFTPDLDFFGTSSITYTVKDDLGDVSNAATITVLVNSVNDAPIATADNASTFEGVATSFDILTNDSDVDGTIDPATVDLDPTSTGTEETVASIPGEGTFSYNAGTGELTFTPDPGFVGTSSITYTVKDDLGETSNTVIISVVVNVFVANPCNPISTLLCQDLDVDVSSGFCLDFNASAGGLNDGSGVGTGFTMVVDPSNPFTNATDPTLPVGAPTISGVDGYEPSLLNIANGLLTIDATKGIMDGTNAQGPGRNSSVNHLGVAFDAGLGQSFDIETEILGLPALQSGGNLFQQAGLYFGLDESRFVKLVAIQLTDTQYKIQLGYENSPTAGNGFVAEKNTGALLNPGDDVVLRLTVDPVNSTVLGSYSVDGGVTFVDVENSTPVPIDPTFISGELLPDGVTGPLSFAGILGTIRNANVPQSFSFERFCINGVPTVPPCVVNNLTPVLCEDAALSVNLTSFEASITAESGSFVYTISGNTIGDPTAVIVSDGQVIDVDFNGSNGCVESSTITFTVNPADTTNVFATTCDPAQVGVITNVLTNQFGCDSTVITTTTLLPSDTTNVFATTCDPNQVGIITNVLTNQFGCDSTVITTTTLLPSDTTNVFATTCDPTQVGIITNVLTNQFGCDSTVITTTTLLPSDTTNVFATTCDPAQVGVVTSVLTNQVGCDSTVITTTTLLPGDTTNIAVTTCDPAQVGVSTSVLTNQFGCDSTVITTTTLLPSDTTNVFATTCDPTQVGVITSILTNQFGCDSTVITATTLLPSDTTNLAATTCDPGQVGVTQQVFTNQFGCDSTVVTTTSLVTLVPNLANVACNDNGTPSILGDDFIVFELTPSGTNLGLAYTLSGDVGAGPTEYTNGTTSYSTVPGSAGAGNLTITVTDTATGCSETIFITDPGACSNAELLTFEFADRFGTNGYDVCVPITVQNYDSIFVGQATITWDPSVVSFDSVTNFGTPGLEALDFVPFGNDKLLLLNVEDPITYPFGFSLADGDTLFEICFTVVGQTGDVSPITFVNAPTPIEWTRSNLGIPVVEQVFLFDGSITIVDPIAVTGAALSWLGDTIEDVSYEMLFPIPDNTVADSFEFVVPANQDGRVTAGKLDDYDPDAGVTGIDVILTQLHILNTFNFTSPYQMLAADVNQSGSITNIDVFFMENIILQNLSTYFIDGGTLADTALWRLIPQGYVFPDPANPWNAPDFRDVLDVQPPGPTDENFLGLKLGDVNFNWMPLNGGLREEVHGEVHMIATVPEHATPGATIKVPVSAKFFKDIASYSYTLNWNPAVLRFVDLHAQANDPKFATHSVDQGALPLLWVQELAQGEHLPDGTVLYELEFEVIGNMGSQAAIDFGESITPMEAYTGSLLRYAVVSSGGSTQVGLQSTSISQDDIEGYHLIQNRPNPFSQSTEILFTVPTREEVTISIYNGIGQLIWEGTDSYMPGTHSVVWNRENQSGHKVANGVYTLVLTAGPYEATLRMSVQP